MRYLSIVAAAVAMTACSAPGPGPGAGPPSMLVARLVSPTDVVLTWHIDDPDAAFRVVEFATEPQGRYTVLEFLPPEQTTYRHPDLMPRTPFYYRVRSVYGPASATVDVALPPGDLDDATRGENHDWAAPATVARGRVVTRSVRDRASAVGAAPAALRATVMHANGIRFTWTDRASDEDGYLLELRPNGTAEFRAAAVLDRDVNAFGLITLPEEKRAAYRVRAFWYGPPSNVAYQMTGRGPA